MKVMFENEDITSKVRTEEMAKLTSTLAAEPISQRVHQALSKRFYEVTWFDCRWTRYGYCNFFRCKT